MSKLYEEDEKKKKKVDEEAQSPLPLFEDEPQGQPREEETPPPAVSATPAPVTPNPETPVAPAPEVPASPTEGITNKDVQKVIDTKIGTAEEIHGKRGEMAANEKKTAEDYIEERKNLLKGHLASYDADTQAMAEAGQRYYEDIKRINDEANQYWQDRLNVAIKEAELARKEHEDASKIERRTIIGTGLAEVGAALVNLIGVAKGAENQNIHLYSADWMKQAERNRKDRVRKLESLNDRRKEIEHQLATMKTAQGKELAQIARANKAYEQGRKSSRDEIEYNSNLDILGATKGAESAYNTATGAADIELISSKGEAVATGLSTNVDSSKPGKAKDTKAVYDEDGIRIIRKPEKGWIKIDIGGKLYWFTPASIKENLETHRNDFGISDAELAAMKPAERLSLLKSKINENPTIQNALRKASFGRAVEGDTEEVKPAEKKDAYSAYE